MDSRIREIEQWVTEAKTDLGEHGREAYLNKLYLLDAEIRSVIRESGMHPAAASPQSAGRRVRRQHAIPVFASGALGMLLLAVSTVYFASPGLGLPFNRLAQASPQAEPELRVVRVPVNIPSGEEIIIDERGESYLNTLPGSPSEEKAGEKTPSSNQASAAGAAALPVSSKPSALAQTPPQAPVSISVPSKKNADKFILSSQPAAGTPSGAGKPAAPPLIDEAIQVLPAVAPAVDKPVVDNADKLNKLDSQALEEQLDSDLS